MRWIFLLLLCSPLFGVKTLQTLSSGNVASYQYFEDDAGNATAVWRITTSNFTGLQASFKPAGTTTWSSAQTISPTNVSQFQLVQDELGNAAVVWIVVSNSVTVAQAAFQPVGSSWEVVGSQTSQDNVLSTLNYNVNALPDIAIANGAVAIAWQIRNVVPNTTITGHNVVQAAIRPKGASGFIKPGPPNVESNILSHRLFNVSQNSPVVDIDTLGNVGVAWQLSATNIDRSVVQLALKAAASSSFLVPGTPNSASNVISNFSLSATVTTPPQIFMAAGVATVTWLANITNVGLVLQAASQNI